LPLLALPQAFRHVRRDAGFGALDGDPGIRPQCHSFVGSKAPWYELPDDGLDRFDEGAPRR
jgi:hypothetical protein